MQRSFEVVAFLHPELKAPRVCLCGLWMPLTVDYISFSQQNPCVRVSVLLAPMGQKPLTLLMPTTLVRAVELHGSRLPICLFEQGLSFSNLTTNPNPLLSALMLSFLFPLYRFKFDFPRMFFF